LRGRGGNLPLRSRRGRGVAASFPLSGGIYHDLYGCRGTITKTKENGIYYVSLVYPSEYQLKEFDGEFIPCWFDESELEFVNKDDERDYKLNKLLYG
jgi:hypothetical protein